MKKTAWSASSSLPSDRIPTRSSPNPPTTSKSKNSSKNNHNARPKSARVQELEKIITALARSQLADPDPKGGCFCQARVHPLSPYTPICHSSCGLILCAANSPAFSCPHCMTPLMTIPEKGALVEKLSKEVVETEEKEEEERRRIEEEKRAAAGAFPTLGEPGSGARGLAAPAPTTHKVLSLTGNAKGKKKVMVSSYTSTPIGSRTGTPDNAGSAGMSTPKKAKEPERLPPPPGPPVPVYPADRGRPFRNLLTQPEWYIHPPQPARLDDDGNPKKPRRRGRGKGGDKGKEREEDGGKENVGDAAAG